jgi:hypothetical protein
MHGIYQRKVIIFDKVIKNFVEGFFFFKHFLDDVFSFRGGFLKSLVFLAVFEVRLFDGNFLTKHQVGWKNDNISFDWLIYLRIFKMKNIQKSI